MISIEQLPDLIDEVAPAVVHLDVSAGSRRWHGSGFLIEPLPGCAGTVITNAHVADGGDDICVTVFDQSQYPARVVAVDVNTDVAILQMLAPAPHTLALRASKQVRVGETVVAIGSPYGLAGTVTIGIVSAIDRTMPAPNRMPIDGMIQTDALINPGNSGGPLIGLDGLVVGVNDQVRLDDVGSSSGLGFAIAADTVRNIIDEVRRSPDHVIHRASIRARLSRRVFTPAERVRWHQPSGAMLVDEPAPGTPAETAGLKRGDVIVALDSELVDEPADVFRLLSSERIGRTCSLRLIRGNELLERPIVPIERT